MDKVGQSVGGIFILGVEMIFTLTMPNPTPPTGCNFFSILNILFGFFHFFSPFKRFLNCKKGPQRMILSFFGFEYSQIIDSGLFEGSLEEFCMTQSVFRPSVYNSNWDAFYIENR